MTVEAQVQKDSSPCAVLFAPSQFPSSANCGFKALGRPQSEILDCWDVGMGSIPLESHHLPCFMVTDSY